MKRWVLTAFVLSLAVGCGGVPKAGNTRVREIDGMAMVYVPAGDFLMGSTAADIDAVMAVCGDCLRPWFSGEQPQHTVYLDAFWMDRLEVTNAQYQGCVDHGVCNASRYRNDSQFGAPDQPVLGVSWHDADTYCRWAEARLPTVAEWEKAASWDPERGEKRLYPWGDEFDGRLVSFCDVNCAYDWRDSTVDDGYSWTAPVGSYPGGASPCGALDMAGNVWEWVADWYGDGYYGLSPTQNPGGPATGEFRVLRGCSWNCDSWRLRAAGRLLGGPSNRNYIAGFRCALSSTPSP